MIRIAFFVDIVKVFIIDDFHLFVALLTEIWRKLLGSLEVIGKGTNGSRHHLLPYRRVIRFLCHALRAKVQDSVRFRRLITSAARQTRVQNQHLERLTDYPCSPKTRTRGRSNRNFGFTICRQILLPMIWHEDLPHLLVFVTLWRPVLRVTGLGYLSSSDLV